MSLENQRLVGEGIVPREAPQGFFTVKRVVIGALTVATAVVVVVLVVLLVTRQNENTNQPPASEPTAPVWPPTGPDYDLAKAVNVSNIMIHLTNFLNIAYSPGYHGSRSVVNGYNASAQYVINTLQENAVDCDIKTQPFVVPIFVENSAPQIAQVSPYAFNYQYNVDFQIFRYGGSGDYNITATVAIIPNLGCADGDWAAFQAGQIALIQYAPVGAPTCDLVALGMNAEKFNASAFIVYNDPSRFGLSRARARGAGWFPGDPLITIPALSATFSFGKALTELSASGPVELNIKSNTTISIVPTFNIICETRVGDAGSTIVVGAHLDSVPEGPGINDNGSGSASLLELVLQFFKLKIPNVAKIKFCWWGAEEIGLLGSRWFVHDLQVNNQTALNQIAMNLNFDMLASPNYIPYIHNVTFPGTQGHPAVADNGSNVITQTFAAFYNSINAKFAYDAMTGGSDYLPFLQAGIPAGGLATGAGGIKSMAERTTFGGLANAAYDPCYHQPCDTTENINQQALQLIASGAAYTIQVLSSQPNLRAYLSSYTPN